MMVTPSPATLGAVVHGVDLRALDEADIAAIKDAFHEHALLVVSDQFLDDREQSGLGSARQPVVAHRPLVSRGRRHGVVAVGAGSDFWTAADKATMEAVRHRLVAVHPVTQCRALFVGRHAPAVCGSMPIRRPRWSTG